MLDKRCKLWYDYFTSLQRRFCCAFQSARLPLCFGGSANCSLQKKREANFLPQYVPCGASDAENFIQEVPTMRVKITLACTECKNRNYVSKKNKKNDPDRIEMMKHCRHCNKHTLHKETK